MNGETEMTATTEATLPRFIVMKAQAQMPASCWGQYGKVAVVECTVPGIKPCRIDERLKTIASIPAIWDRQHIGTTERSAFAQACAAAEELCQELNEENS